MSVAALTRGATNVAKASTPAVREFDAVVVGAGPVGSVTANLLRKTGANVLLLESRAGNAPGRFTMPVLDEGSREIIKSVGGGSMFRPHLAKEGVATKRFEHITRRLAKQAGVDVRYSAEATTLRQGAHGVEMLVHTPKGDMNVRAKLVVDATGERWAASPLKGGMRQLPEQTEFAIGHWPYQKHLKPLWDLRHPNGRVGLFGPNGPKDGAAGAMEISLRRLTPDEHAKMLDKATRTEEYTRWGREAGLKGTPDSVTTFPLVQKLADHAVKGRVVGAGDTIGRVNFKTASGLNAGIRDAARIRDLWLSMRAAGDDQLAVARAFKRYDAESIHDHALAVAKGRARFYPKGAKVPPLPDFPKVTAAEKELASKAPEPLVVTDMIPAVRSTSFAKAV